VTITEPAGVASIAQLIELAIGPVFLISGVGVTLNVLTSRLARIVDRARNIESQLENATDESRARQHNQSLDVAARRTRLINGAITLATLSALFTAIVVVMLFSSAFTTIDFSVAIAVLFVTAMLCLAAAFLVFLIEVRIATAALRIGRR
jgi:CBS domain containing-hemolysin-like protein